MESPTSLLAAAALHSSPPPRVPRPRRPRRRLTVAGLIAVIVAVAAPAADADTRTLALLTDGPFMTDPALGAEFSTESADGSRIFFTTKEALAGTDTDAATDVYVRTTAGGLVHVSDNPLAPDGPYDASLQFISADGTRAFFTSPERLAATDTDTDTEDAYEWKATGGLVHASDNPTAADAEDRRAEWVGVTPDGKHAYFDTTEQLAATDTDTASDDIYERASAGPIHVSDGEGTDPGADVEFSSVSDDGARVYFGTAGKLLPSDADDEEDVYLHTASGALVHVSDDGNNPDPDIEAYFAGASPDGARVWFDTAEQLAATDTDTATDVYERQASGALVHVTRDPTGPEADVDAFFLDSSADGRRIVFETKESLAASDTDTALDVYERRADAMLVHVSDDPTGPDANADAFFGDLSPDGTRLVFNSKEPLAATDGDAAYDVYERVPNGRLIHVSDDPSGPDDARDAWGDWLSSDSTRVLFASEERLAATDTDAAWDTYELSPAGLAHVTDDPTGPDANLDAFLEHASPDGRRVYFKTLESLSRADTDVVDDIYASTRVPSAPATPQPADRVAPVVTRFKVARSGRLRFALSEPADVRVVVRRRGAHARARVLADRPAGLNRARVRLRARGRYRVTITATDAAGNRSAPQRASLQIRRAR